MITMQNGNKNSNCLYLMQISLCIRIHFIICESSVENDEFITIFCFLHLIRHLHRTEKIQGADYSVILLNNHRIHL